MENALLQSLLARRSVPVKDLVAPAPNADELALILRVATRVPDHGKLAPWRIIVLHADGQARLGEVAAKQFARLHADASPAQMEAEQSRFSRAPLVLAVISTPVFDAKPVWEQELSAGAVCMNILHAVHAMGYGGKWLTEWVAYDTKIRTALEGSADDKIAGFIYIGSKTAEPADRERPNLEEVVREY